MIKNEKKKSILYVVRLESTISMLTAIRSIQRAKRDSDGYRFRKYITLKSILFIMFANLKLVLRRYTCLYDIFMSASLTLYSYILERMKKKIKLHHENIAIQNKPLICILNSVPKDNF